MGYAFALEACRISTHSHEGVFAGENIPKGSFLGVYAGELLLDAEGDVRGKQCVLRLMK
jgi:hypothetical protein